MNDISQQIKPFKDFGFFTLEMVDACQNVFGNVKNEIVTKSEIEVVGAELSENDLFSCSDVFMFSTL